jgi:hypothetical protein
MVASRDIYVLVCVNGPAFVLCGHDMADICQKTTRHDHTIQKQSFVKSILLHISTLSCQHHGVTTNTLLSYT